MERARIRSGSRIPALTWDTLPRFPSDRGGPVDSRSNFGAGAKALLVMAAFFVVIGGVKVAGQFLTPLLIALFIALISLPLLNFMRSKRIPIGLSVLATLAADALILATPLWVVGRSLRAFTIQVPRYQERLDALARKTLDWIEARGIDLPPDLTDQILQPGIAIDLVGQTLQGAAAALSNLVLIILTVTFILLEAAGFPQKLERAF
ncbi:MAG: AI-2E family transporter, partial [Planctomycetota bacterium]|nr:AI-2E family transporter [Planctomycetota bacterium]